MVLVVVVLLAALVVATLRGGRLSRLGKLPLRRTWLVPVALALQVLGALKGGPAYPLGLVASLALVGTFLALNRRIRGTAMVALGLLANAVVVGLNGAMPVSLDATGRAGVTTHDIARGQDPRHEVAGPGTRLRLLGDVIPVLLPGHPEVVSPGDVLIAAGLAELVVVGMLPVTVRLRRRPARVP